jgi:hypothetical protein
MVTADRAPILRGEIINPHDRVEFKHIPGMGYLIKIILDSDAIAEIRRISARVKEINTVIDSVTNIENGAIRITSAVRPAIPVGEAQIPDGVKTFFTKTVSGFEIYAELDKNIQEIVDGFDKLSFKSKLTLAPDADELFFEVMVKRDGLGAGFYR